MVSFRPVVNSTSEYKKWQNSRRDAKSFTRFAVGGKSPRVVVRVSVEEAFNHCPKAFVRAKLWDANAHRSGAPTHGDFAASRDGNDATYAKDYNQKYAQRLKTDLY